MAGRGSGMVEVITMRAAAMATTAVVNLYPIFPLAMCVFLASSYRWVTVMHEIPISSAPPR